jgi:hypothetical protein
MYPRPICCLHDKGLEPIGKKFQWLLELFSIKDVFSTSKNPSHFTLLLLKLSFIFNERGKRM